MKGGLGSAPSAALGCWRKKGVFTCYRAASSQSVLSYKFTSQTLTGAGVSCVCSSGSCLFGKREMLQWQGEGWGGLGCLGRALPHQAKCLLEATSLLIPAPKGTKPSQRLPSIRSEHLSQFCFPPSLCQLAVVAYLHQLHLVTSIKKVTVAATSPLQSRGDQAQLVFPHRSCLRTMGAGVKAAMFCTHSWAVSPALTGDLDRPLSPGGFQKTSSLCCDRFFWC